jgi:uncharacterized protein (DUF983 family)
MGSGLFLASMMMCILGVMVYLLVLREFKGRPPVWIRVIFGLFFLLAFTLFSFSLYGEK